MDPFRRCLELAWQSCVEGNIGVGAVITDESGAILAEGRNRVLAELEGLEPVEGTTLAHAEINALVKLRRRTGGHATCTLWTSLEPCVQCAAALHLARISDIRFLAADPVWDGSHRLADVLPDYHADRRPVMVGPETTIEAAFAALLPLHFAAFWIADSPHWAWWRTNHPAWAALADDVAASGRVIDLAARGV